MNLQTISNFELQLRYNLAVKIIDEAQDDPRVSRIEEQLEILEDEMRRRGLLANENVNPVEDENKGLIVGLKTLSITGDAKNAR